MMPTFDSAAKKKAFVLVALLIVLAICFGLWSRQNMYRKNLSSTQRLGESSYRSDSRDLPNHQVNTPGQTVVLNAEKLTPILSMAELNQLQQTLLETFYANTSLAPSLASIEGKVSEADNSDLNFTVVTDVEPSQEYSITTTSAGHVTNVSKKE